MSSRACRSAAAAPDRWAGVHFCGIGMPAPSVPSVSSGLGFACPLASADAAATNASAVRPVPERRSTVIDEFPKRNAVQAFREVRAEQYYTTRTLLGAVKLA